MVKRVENHDGEDCPVHRSFSVLSLPKSSGLNFMPVPKPMTIGQLARRTGVSIKVLREYDRLGLIYTLGRSESNYRLFDESALWCVQVIGTLRSLGLTLKEIREI